MRKAIIVILTIFIILGFSSCDALLEGFFPEFGEAEVKTATLEIYADAGYFNTDNNYNSKPIYVVIKEIGGDLKNISFMFKASENNGTFQKSVIVPRKEYEVWICMDEDDDKTVDSGEYSDYAAYFYDSANDKIYDNCDLTNTDIGDNVAVGVYLGEEAFISKVPPGTTIP